MRLKLAAIALGIVVVASAFGASAFSTGTVSRHSSIQVADDTNGLVGLAPGNAGGHAFGKDANGRLTFDVGNGTAATGVNANSTFTIGDQTATSPTSAFNITNNAATSHSFALSYTLDHADVAPNTENVKVTVYNAGTKVTATSATEDADSSSFSIPSGETRQVVVTLNTHGLDSTNDLSGTLNVTA